MKKRILLLLAAIAAITPGITSAKNRKKKHKQCSTIQININNIDPANVVFCWDIHDTLLIRDQKKFEKMKSKLIKKLFFKCWEAWDLVIKAKNRGAASAYTAYQLRQKAACTQNKRIACELMKIADIFDQFELTYTHRPGVLEMLNGLKDRGYTLHVVASNIDCFKYLELKPMFPEIFNGTMVQDGLTVNAYKHYDEKHFDALMKQHGITVDAYSEYPKPHRMFFAKLHTKYNPNYKKTLIFIDDKQENVDAAIACGMIGIRITSVDQLLQELRNIGINIQ